jgi:hypothetical protein
VAGGWRRLHNEELHDLYGSRNIIRVIDSRRIRWAGHVARIGEMRNAYKGLVRRPERKKPLGRPGRRWNSNKGKGKVVPVLNQAPRHEGVLGVWRYSSTQSLTLALDGIGQLHAQAALHPRERTPGTHWIGGCVGPRAFLNAVVKKKIPSPLREWNPRIPIGPARSPALYRLS